jgi:hypothetical protein
MDPKILDQYEKGGDKLRAGIAGLSVQDLLWTPPPDAGIGKWSIQQIVLHLMDADLISTARMKLIIAEDHPTILAFNEDKFTANLFYEKQDAAMAVEILDLNRRQFAIALRKVTPSAFLRTGNHNERGTITLGQLVGFVIEHLDNHLKFIHQKREKLGKPLKG